MPSKERQIYTRLLLKYKELTYLWNKNDASYTNRSKREAAYKILLEIYKELDEEATVPEMKKKIENMRAGYAREVKKVRASILEGKNGIVHEPTLWYFDLFEFLRKNEALTCGTILNNQTADEDDDPVYIEVLDTNAEESETDSDGQGESKGISPIQRKRMSIGRQQTENIEKVILEDPVQTSNLSSSDLQVMGKSIALQLKGVNNEQLVIANKLISDIIFHARLGRLTVESSISLRKPYQIRDIGDYCTLYTNEAEQTMESPKSQSSSILESLMKK